jgi:hypothetical protein
VVVIKEMTVFQFTKYLFAEIARAKFVLTLEQVI